MREVISSRSAEIYFGQIWELTSVERSFGIEVILFIDRTITTIF